MPMLYRDAESAEADRIEDELRDLAIKFDVRVAGRDERPEELPSDADTPALVDEGSVFTSPEAISQRIEHLGRVVEQWNKYQSDACYIDENGNVC